MTVLRHFVADGPKEDTPAPSAIQSEFLRLGRILRGKDRWDFVENRYMTMEEVAERTGRALQVASERTHERINSVHDDIKFPKLVFHRTLENRPHLGYCHVTAANTRLLNDETFKWSFYIANFKSEIDEGLKFVGKLDNTMPRMYFAVAMENDREKPTRMVVDRQRIPGGILFQTHDPKTALKNVLMLGTDDPVLRAKIRRL